jgi:cell division control protein 24
MDPLSVAASIAGLLSAAGAVAKLLGPYITAARETPEIAVAVHTEVHAATIILSALQDLTQNMASASVQRAAFVQADQVIAILTDGVLLFSHLEATVGSLLLGDSPITTLDFASRLQWARKDTELTSILTRLQGFKASISLMLSIFQTYGTIDHSLRTSSRSRVG